MAVAYYILWLWVVRVGWGTRVEALRAMPTRPPPPRAVVVTVGRLDRGTRLTRPAAVAVLPPPPVPFPSLSPTARDQPTRLAAADPPRPLPHLPPPPTPPQIIAAVAHPRYRNTGPNLEYDFAILTIGNPPTAAEYRAAGIEPAFVNAFSRFPRPGRTMTLVGHGDTRGTAPSVPFDLGLARVPVNAWEQCNAWWVKLGQLGTVRPAGADRYQVCGGLGSAQASCFGDSGSPLFERASINGRFFNRVHGVVSYGFPDVANPTNRCGTLNPDYYAKVSAARSFIRENT